jgi:hypothetical protein
MTSRSLTAFSLNYNEENNHPPDSPGVPPISMLRTRALEASTKLVQDWRDQTNSKARKRAVATKFMFRTKISSYFSEHRMGNFLQLALNRFKLQKVILLPALPEVDGVWIWDLWLLAVPPPWGVPQYSPNGGAPAVLTNMGLNPYTLVALEATGDCSDSSESE